MQKYGECMNAETVSFRERYGFVSPPPLSFSQSVAQVERRGRPEMPESRHYNSSASDAHRWILRRSDVAANCLYLKRKEPTAMRALLVTAVLISAVGHASHADEKADAPARDQTQLLKAPFDEAAAVAAQTAWGRFLGKSDPVVKNSLDMELVLIPPGRFTMGSPPAQAGRKENETHVEVTLTRVFYLRKTEVTQREWRAVMGTTPWQEWDEGKGRVREGENYPAVCISWENANEFCKKLSAKEKSVYRLPTEAEWEYACRGGSQALYSFGNEKSDLGDHAWFKENTVHRPASVKTPITGIFGFRVVWDPTAGK
jgi:formylglycine-generating enzyme required for sulfatase activity